MEGLPPCLNLWTKTRRIHATVAYDGTDFCGFAAQTGRRTVQGTLTETVRRITGEENEIIGASRTDSGAHAKGQSIHFDSAVNVPISKWKSILNRGLPEDVRIVKARLAEPDFHARFSTDFRRYRYRILLKNDDPFQARFGTWSGYDRLDIEAMQAASRFLIGQHDFRRFTQELEPWVENTTRELHNITLQANSAEVSILIDGNAFLRGMMRRISGFLLEVGKGQRTPAEAKLFLDLTKPERQLPMVLPAKGLCLEKVFYANPPVDCRTRSNGFVTSEDAE